MLTPTQWHLLMTCGYVCPGKYRGQYSEKGRMEIKMENTMCDRRDSVNICHLTSTVIDLKRMLYADVRVCLFVTLNTQTKINYPVL